jgi:hypothetical protein
MNRNKCQTKIFFVFFVFCFLRFVQAWTFQQEGISYSYYHTENHETIHVLNVDPLQYDIIGAKAFGETLESVSVIAQQHHAIAGINGGFFQEDGVMAHLPTGILKIDNQWIATPTKPRGAIGWSNTDHRVLFDRVLTSITAHLGNHNLPVDGINLIRQDNQAILYNRFYQANTATQSGIEFFIKKHTIMNIVKKDAEIPIDGFVFSVGNSRAASLPEIPIGSPFSWEIQVIPQSNPPNTTKEEWSHVAYIVGGAPILIQADQVITDFSPEKTRQSFIDGEHARTAVGLLPNGYWIFLVADGHHMGKKMGLTIPALAEFMKRLGCIEALNLDGGGSSTMVLNGEIVNSPSGEERDEKGNYIRKVSNAILIIPKSVNARM